MIRNPLRHQAALRIGGLSRIDAVHGWNPLGGQLSGVNRHCSSRCQLSLAQVSSQITAIFSALFLVDVTAFAMIQIGFLQALNF